MSYFSAFSNAGLSFVTKLGEIVAPLEEDEEGDDGLASGDRMGVKMGGIENKQLAEEAKPRVVNHTSLITSVACEDVVDGDPRAASHIPASKDMPIQRYEPREHPFQGELSPSLMVDIELNDTKPIPTYSSTFSFSNNFAGESGSVGQIQQQERKDLLGRQQQLLQKQQFGDQQRKAIMQEDESDQGDELNSETIETKHPPNITSSHTHLPNSFKSINGGRNCEEVRHEITPSISSAASSIPVHPVESTGTICSDVFTPIANDFSPYHPRSQVPPTSSSSVGNMNGKNLVGAVKEYGKLQTEVQQQEHQKQQVESNFQKLPNSHQFRENSLEFRNKIIPNSNVNQIPSVPTHQKEIPRDGVSEQPFWNILERIEHTERCILQEDLQQEQQLSSFLTGKIGEKRTSVNIIHQ